MTTTNNQVLTTQEVATRYHELAQQEKWFEIQDEFFADNARSIDPVDSPYFGYAEGKVAKSACYRDIKDNTTDL